MAKAAHTKWLTGIERRRMYAVWSGMHARCSNPKNKSFDRYGARGISVCDRWASFEMFLADMAPRPNGALLERVDNSAGYSPANCRWATAKEQSRNKRNNRLIEINGQAKCMTEWADIFGVTRELVRDRISRGWSIVRALTEPTARERLACAAGHLRTPENLYVSPGGKRGCRACMRLASARYKARKTARISATGEQA